MTFKVNDDNGLVQIKRKHHTSVQSGVLLYGTAGLFRIVPDRLCVQMYQSNTRVSVFCKYDIRVAVDNDHRLRNFSSRRHNYDKELTDVEAVAAAVRVDGYHL